MYLLELPMHKSLHSRSRLRLLSGVERPISVSELLVLVSLGSVAAGLATFWDMGLKLPGHAILRVSFPMMLGMALVPRRGSGTMLSAVALITTVVFHCLGWGTPGLGALTSLSLFGVITDFVMGRTGTGSGILSRFALVGFLTNLAAFAIRGGSRLANVAGSAKASWWFYAPFTYALCGILSGMICGMLWFSQIPRKSRNPVQQDGKVE